MFYRCLLAVVVLPNILRGAADIIPAAPLITGHASPKLAIADLVGNCTWLQPTNRGPSEDSSTQVYFSLSIDRLIDIRDVDEAICISATMHFRWIVSTCSASTTAPELEEGERVAVADSSQVWHPTIIFANSSDDIYMESTTFGSSMEALYAPTHPNRTLYFFWRRYGHFTSKCALNHRKFPFDEQRCEMTFLLNEPTNFLTFGAVKLMDTALTSNGLWSLVSSGSTMGLVRSELVLGNQSSLAVFHLTFQRNPSYHVSNLLAPCYVLISLVLGSFLMPPEKPDRPVICCTILLAFVVAQSDVLGEVPRKSQRILLAEYILLFTGLTGIVTMYDMLACGFNHAKGVANNIVPIFAGKWPMRIVRIFDATMFLFALNFFIIINLYAALIILA